MDKPIIVMLPYESCSGLELFGIRFSETLKNMGVSVAITSPNNGLIHKQCIRRNIPHIHIPALYKYDIRALYYCYKIFKEYSPRATVAFRTQMMYPISFVHNLIGQAIPQFLFYRIGAGNHFRIDPIHRILFKKLSAVIPNADHVKNKILKYWAISPKKVVCIKSGVDTQKYRPDKARRSRFRQELGISDEVFLIGSTGRIHPEKGSEILLRALFSNNGAAHNRKDVHLVYIGREYKPGYANYLKNIAKSLNVASRFHIAVFRDDVETLYSALDLFAFAVISHETYAYVALEAMASGLPVIVPSTGGMKEMFENEKEGFFFEHRNTSSLILALSKALSLDSNQLLQMGEMGRNRIVKNASWEHMMQKYFKLFERAGVKLNC